jgi:hypothetical protein
VRTGASEPGSAAAAKVFITYRRDETAAHAGRLYDAMVGRFGESNVFMDVDMAPGVDFVERITEAVAACHVLIVVMGPSWATVEDERGTARLADPEDFVRLEVETALRRPDVTPIPVLVAGARMPNREELPPEVRAITRRNALELGDQRWRYDVERLISALDELLAESPSVPASPGETSDRATVHRSPAPPGPKRPPTKGGAKSSSQTPGPERWPRWGWGLGLTLLGTLWLPLASLIDPAATSADTVAAFVGAAVVIVIAAPILMSWRSGAQGNSPMQVNARPPLTAACETLRDRGGVLPPSRRRHLPRIRACPRSVRELKIFRPVGGGDPRA